MHKAFYVVLGLMIVSGGAAAENAATRKLLEIDASKRHFLLMLALDQQPCGLVTHGVFHMGTEDRHDLDVWSVRCSNGKRYGVILPPDLSKNGRPMTCAELDEFAGLFLKPYPAGEAGDTWGCALSPKRERLPDVILGPR